MQLHWGIYLLVGIVVTAVSAFQEGLGIFIVVGVIFLFIGIVKFIMGKNKLGRDATPPKRKAIPNLEKCKHCHAWNYPHASTCHHCGKNPHT